ncbi:MAG: Zn-ribbon domain-containing OB-fold protein [Dehalococcoidia bacterium]
MGFENFGIVSFTTQGKASDFVDYLEKGKVMATRCLRCGISYFPPRLDCPKCPGSEVEWFEIKGNGRLSTYTVVNYGPTGFEEDAPYTLAIADFDGVRVFGRLSKSIKESDIKPGMGLKVVPVKLSGDRIGYEFQRA